MWCCLAAIDVSFILFTSVWHGQDNTPQKAYVNRSIRAQNKTTKHSTHQIARTAICKFQFFLFNFVIFHHQINASLSFPLPHSGCQSLYVGVGACFFFSLSCHIDRLFWKHVKIRLNIFRNAQIHSRAHTCACHNRCVDINLNVRDMCALTTINKKKNETCTEIGFTDYHFFSLCDWLEHSVNVFNFSLLLSPSRIVTECMRFFFFSCHYRHIAHKYIDQDVHTHTFTQHNTILSNSIHPIYFFNFM